MPNLQPPISPPVVTPTFVSLSCGQDVTLPSVPLTLLLITCQIFNGSDPIITEVFKDGVLYGNSFSVAIFSFGESDFGTYTFRASVEGCGVDTAESRIQGSK